MREKERWYGSGMVCWSVCIILGLVLRRRRECEVTIHGSEATGACNECE